MRNDLCDLRDNLHLVQCGEVDSYFQEGEYKAKIAMSTASALRAQIEAALADRIPSALTPAPRVIRPVAPTGIDSVDALLEGGLPIGAITEVVGPECSGRTSLALSFVARITQEGKVCAWIDVSNALDPQSAASQGVDLNSLLWVRCGVSSAPSESQPKSHGFTVPEKYFEPKPAIQGLHGGGCGPHPRGEVKGLSHAVGDFLRSDAIAPRCAESQPQLRRQIFETGELHPVQQRATFTERTAHSRKPWLKIDQALRVTDLLLQAGGFAAIVLDMAGIAPEHASRVPLATWFRYRAAAERSQASILLLTQHPCARSSAALLLRLEQGHPFQHEPTVFTGIEHWIEVSRERFKPASNVIPLRKPPKSVTKAAWQSSTAWTGRS